MGWQQRVAFVALGMTGGLVSAGAAVAAPAIEVTASVLNVRTGAGTSNAKIGQLSRGQIYPLLRRSGNWVQIQFDRRAGWSYAPYTREVSRTLSKVTAAALNVRSGPSTGYRVLGQLPRNALVATTSSSGSWRRLFYGGRTAYVHGNYLAAAGSPPPPTTPPPAPAATHVVNVGTLNLRSGPSTGYRVLTAMRRGDQVTSLEVRGSWRKVRHPRATGWCYSPYLRQIGGPPTSSAGFINLPASGPGFVTYQSSYRRWGTPTLIYGMQRAARRYVAENASRPRVAFGDISLARGGYFPPHVSHRYGVDFDARPARKDSSSGAVTITQSAYSRVRTQRIFDFMRSELPVTLILFNDRGTRGTTWYSGHGNHFHLRIRR